MNLNKIQEILFVEYKNNGYLDMWNNCYVVNSNGKFEHDFRKADIAELGLIVTEISEAQEVIRQNKYINNLRFKLKIECVDVIIRTLNFMSRKNMLVESAILRKNKLNLNRGLLHGKEF